MARFRDVFFRSLLFGLPLFALLACCGASAQSPAVLVLTGPRPCARLSIGSDEPAIAIPIERALRATPAFARGEFSLTDTPGGADVVIFVRSARLLPQAVLTYNLRADGTRPYALLQNQSRSDVIHPQNLANEIVETLHRACSGSADASAPGNASATQGETPRRTLPLPSPLTEAERAERMRALRTVRVVVHSSQMEAGDVRAALAQDAGLRARNVSAVLGAADATLEITHEDASSRVWKFALIDSRSNALLGAGRVFALHGSHAAPVVAFRLAQMLVPGTPTNTRAVAVRAALERLGREPQWKAQLASEAYGGASGGDPLELAVEDDRLVAYARDTGRRVFSIPLDDIEDLEFGHEWHSPATDAMLAPLYEDPLGNMERNGYDPNTITLAALLTVPWVVTAEALTPIRTRQHFLTIAWRENEDEPKLEIVVLQVPGKEMKSLKAALAPLTVARK